MVFPWETVKFDIAFFVQKCSTKFIQKKGDKKMRKTIISVAIAAAIFTGCGGPSDERVAELCGQKSFNEQKEAYKKSYFYEKNEEVEVYKYCLRESKTDNFDVDLFAKSVDMDYQKLKTEFNDKLQKMRDNLDKITITQLQNEMAMYAFAMGRAKAIDNYVKALEQLQKSKWEMISAAKKAEKEQQRERFLEAQKRDEVGTIQKIDVFNKAQK